MFKSISIVAISALALMLTVATNPAAARNGGAVAAGVIGGLAVGAIIGSQANRNYYSGPGYVEQSGYRYGNGHGYRRCHTERRQVMNQNGHYRIRRVRVCD